MDLLDQITHFYRRHIPGAVQEKNILKAPCPLVPPPIPVRGESWFAYLNPDSFFTGYFRCLNRCQPGGFPLHLARLIGIEPDQVPGYILIVSPSSGTSFIRLKMTQEIIKFTSLMTVNEYEHFRAFGVSEAVVDEMSIGYNGRYLVYPYVAEDGNSYAARCITAWPAGG